MIFNFSWPDELDLSLHSLESDEILFVGALIQLRQYSHAESCLLARGEILDSSQSYNYMRALLLIRQGRNVEYSRLVASWPSHWLNTIEAKILWVLHLLDSKLVSSLIEITDEYWSFPEEEVNNYMENVVILVRSMVAVATRKIDEAMALLNQLHTEYSNCFDAVYLKARILASQLKFEDALRLLMPAVLRFPAHEKGSEFLCELALAARSQDMTIPIFHQAFSSGHRSESLLIGAAQVHLLKSNIADSRRVSLQERLLSSISGMQTEPLTNLINCYDRLGCADWLDYIHPVTEQRGDTMMPLRQNLMMQFSSYGSQKLRRHAGALEQDLSRMAIQRKYPVSNIKKNISSRPHKNKNITIAWCCSDINYHPVFRFIYSMFASTTSTHLRHLIVDTFDHKNETSRDLLQGISSITTIRPTGFNERDKVASIQGLDADLAIDLSGWTGGHFQSGFLSRIAPIQINYLGYFATVGLSSSDIWLGDEQLFPNPIKEWHTEDIYRLSRCFIAWQPADPLPEARVEVPDPISYSGGIRFGSFNANRKLSDLVLSTWAQLLVDIPDAQLVLKASNWDDSNTMELLRRRMLRQGMDPERIIWLARTSTPDEHLLQYASLDIALDTFPNGGCTTTCEALWMGVPVVTLSGPNYVGRMSTAVLYGADMADWCALSTDDYIQICKNQSANVSQLRRNRSQWRQKLQKNPLGDAPGLIHSLEHAFVDIFNSRISRINQDRAS